MKLYVEYKIGKSQQLQQLYFIMFVFVYGLQELKFE